MSKKIHYVLFFTLTLIVIGFSEDKIHQSVQDSSNVMESFDISDFESLGFTEESMGLDSSQMPSERRIKMLGWHQRLGIATAGLMTATLLTGRDGEATDLHKTLGITTGLFYYTTACFSLFAPKPEVKKESGNIILHKYLAWVHGTAMIMAPFLGYFASKKLDEKGAENGLNNPENTWELLLANHGNIVRTGYYSFIGAMFVMVIEF